MRNATTRHGFAVFVVLASLSLHEVGAQPEAAQTSSKTYVLLHGGGSGGWQWKEFAPLLAKHGHVVYRPTLTGLGERVHLANPDVDLDVHIEDVIKVLEYEELEDVILVGRSYSGMVVTGVIDRVPERIKHVVYVDAFLPKDGESVATIFPWLMEGYPKQVLEGGSTWQYTFSTLPKVVPVPIKTFTQPLALSPQHPKVPGTFILTIEPGKTEDNFTPSAERAKSYGWPVHVLRTGHNPHVTMPEELAALLLDIE